MAIASAVAGLCLLAVGGMRWLHRASELQRFRVSLHYLSETIRSIRPRATATRRSMVLRADPAHRVFQVSALQAGRRAYEMVEKTVWLPEGLEIVEAPASLTVLPAQRLTRTTIVIAAPAYNCFFRLTLTPEGAVQLDEEPAT